MDESEDEDKHGFALWKSPRDENIVGWRYTDEKEELYEKLAVISHVSFQKCGYQNMDWGLVVTLQIHDGGSISWTFPVGTQIKGFLDTMKAKKLEDCIGKPVYALFDKPGECWGTWIRGIAINKRLIVDARKW